MATPQNRPMSIERNTNESNREFYSMAARIKRASSPYVPKLKHAIHKRLLTYLMALACILGACVGILLRLRKEPYSERERMHLRFPGEIMVNLLNLLVLPLVVSSIISGISLEDTWDVGKLSLRTFGYFLLTYVVSAGMGIVFAISVFPTKKHSRKHRNTDRIQMTLANTVINFIRISGLKQSLLVMGTRLVIFVVVAPSMTDSSHGEKKSPLSLDISYLYREIFNNSHIQIQLVKEVITMPGVNMVGIIVVSLAGGIVINRLGEKGLPLRIFFDAIFEITMVLIGIVNWYTPIGVFFLVVDNVVGMDTDKNVPQQATFFIAVIAALLIHSIFILPFICFVVCRRNPYVFINKIMNVLVTAIGTSSRNDQRIKSNNNKGKTTAAENKDTTTKHSKFVDMKKLTHLVGGWAMGCLSLATLPFLVKKLEDRKMNLDLRTVGFVAPIGSSVNMDGSAIFNTIAIIFLGNLEGLDFGFLKMLSIGFLSITAAISAAGTPQGGLVAVTLLADSVGLAKSNIEYLVPLDWIVDRFVTATNVLSDAFGCVVVHQLTRRKKRRKRDSDDQYDSTFTTGSSSQSEETNPDGVQSVENTVITM